MTASITGNEVLPNKSSDKQVITIDCKSLTRQLGSLNFASFCSVSVILVEHMFLMGKRGLKMTDFNLDKVNLIQEYPTRQKLVEWKEKLTLLTIICVIKT